MRSTTVTTTDDIETADSAVRDALAAEGFGVLTEIDVAATFKNKLGVDRTPLRILGACNPQLAREALDADPDAALVLPCNVVLEATAAGTRISAADPHEIISSPLLRHLADEADTRLRRALEAIGSS